MENLSKTELIQKLTEAEEKLNKYLNNDNISTAAKELETLKKDYSKLTLKYGEAIFKLIIKELQLDVIKSRNLWDRIWNK